MDHTFEERFVASFVEPRERARVRRWLQDPGSRSKALEKLPHGFRPFLDARFVHEDVSGMREKFARERARHSAERVYHIGFNRQSDGTWMNEAEYRSENGGYYDSLIAIVDPEHCAAYVMEGGSRWLYLLR